MYFILFTVYAACNVVNNDCSIWISTGAERTPEAKELIYVRQKFVMIAKAFRIQAIDMVYVDIHGKFILFEGKNF